MNQIISQGTAAEPFLTADNLISLLSVTVAIVGIYLIVRQLRIQNLELRLATLQSSYLANLELQKILLEHPELVRLYVGGIRHGHVANAPEAALKALVRGDLILDHAEFQYLSTLESRPSDAEALIASHFSNPDLRQIWNGDLRGRFDSRFAAAVEHYISSL